jgi:hypothetical protein
MTRCHCTGPGYCETLGRDMPTRLFALCQTRDDYRALFRRLAGLEAGEATGCSACEEGERRLRESSPSPAPDTPSIRSTSPIRSAGTSR